MTKSDLEVISSYLGKSWDGKSSILRMQYDNYNQWKQMEWAGFYLQGTKSEVYTKSRSKYK